MCALRLCPSLAAAISFLATVATAACVDQPSPIAPPGQTEPVNNLSQLGVYQQPLSQLNPTTDFVPYDVNLSLYADGAQKERLLHLPPGSQVGAEADRWDIPLGSYFVKTFYFLNDARDATQGRHLVETRFLVRTDAGFQVSTYLWNADQTDAVASGGNVDVPISWVDPTGASQQTTFHVPGVSLCQSCHQNRALGLRTRQMDMAGTYPDGATDQISHLVTAQLLDSAPPPGIVLVGTYGTDPLDARARSYLDANCSHCHGKGGIAEGTQVIWSYEQTTGSTLPLCMKVPAVDGDSNVIVPGSPNHSVFLDRMKSSDAFSHMPQGESHVPDADATAVLSEWVAQMTPAGCP